MKKILFMFVSAFLLFPLQSHSQSNLNLKGVTPSGLNLKDIGSKLPGTRPAGQWSEIQEFYHVPTASAIDTRINALQYDFAVDREGTVFIVYNHLDQPGIVYGNCPVSWSGCYGGGDRKVNNTPAGFIPTDPKIAASGDKFMMVWTEVPTGSSDGYGRIVFSSFPSYPQVLVEEGRHPVIVPNLRGGFKIAFERRGDIVVYSIKADETWETPLSIPSAHGFYPNLVAYDSTFLALRGFSNTPEGQPFSLIEIKQLFARGEPFYSFFGRITLTPQEAPPLAINHTDHLLFTPWVDLNSKQVHVTQCSIGGGDAISSRVSLPVPLNPSRAIDQPRISMNSFAPSGHGAVVWTQRTEGGTKIFSSTYGVREEGLSWSTPFEISGTEAAFKPDVAVNQGVFNKSSLAVFQECPGGDCRIWANFYDGFPPVRVNANEAYAHSPRVKMTDANGKAAVLWLEEHPDHTKIMLRRYTPPGSGGS